MKVKRKYGNISLMKAISGTCRGFARNTTMHGIRYAFDENLVFYERLIWVLICVSFIFLATYWISESYISWQDFPVITSVHTTGKAISQLAYPAITICGQGWIKRVVDMAQEKQFKDYVEANYPNVAFNRLTFEKRAELMKKLQEDLFPGARESPRAITESMSALNPATNIKSKIALAKGYDPCQSLATGYVEKSCGPGWQQVLQEPFCSREEGPSSFQDDLCFKVGGKRLELYNTKALLEPYFIAFMNNRSGVENAYWLNAVPINGEFIFPGNSERLNDFPFLIPSDPVPRDSNSTFCGLQVYRNKSQATISYRRAPCESKAKNFCFKELLQCNNTTSPKRKRQTEPENPSSLDYVFDPLLKAKAKDQVRLARQRSSDNFKAMNMTASYEGLFELLWYTQIPCYDVKGTTSLSDMQNGMLKACYWKGKEIPCGLIFKTSPTDRGMCCTFNLEAAESMFKEGSFTHIIEKMQRRDKKERFRESDHRSTNYENPFEDAKRPIPQVGKSKGLTVILDAHSDIVAGSSVQDDVEGFFAIIDSSNQYPTTLRKSLLLRPGHANMVALKATEITAAGNLEKIDPQKRQCYFPNEKKMDIHQKYSQSNCLLECSLRHSLKKMNGSCMPWYFPITNHSMKMCDPWEAFDFASYFKDVPDTECSDCLPDCSSTLIEASVSASPFRRCDRKNFGTSGMCNFESKRIINPPIWGHSVREEYGDEVPAMLKGIGSSIRVQHASTNIDDTIFKKTNIRNPTYNAYEKDIALATFYFESSTAFEFKRQPRMTPTDFISQLGGLLGLCIGFSFISATEIVYWFLLRAFRNI